MHCPHCKSEILRLSRLRTSDLTRLLLLQYPFRCRECHSRGYAGLHRAVPIFCAARTRAGDARQERQVGTGRGSSAG